MSYKNHYTSKYTYVKNEDGENNLYRGLLEKRTFIAKRIESFFDTENINVIKGYGIYNIKTDNLILPRSIKRIERGGFKNCQIKSIKIENPDITLCPKAFDSCDIEEIILPKSLMEKIERVYDTDTVKMYLGVYSSAKFKSFEENKENQKN